MTRLLQIRQNALVESRRRPPDLEKRIENWVANDLILIGVKPDGVKA